MAKKKETKAGASVGVTFTVPCFNYLGVEYRSADVMKAAEAGDQDALFLIAELVRIQDGVINATPLTTEA